MSNPETTRDYDPKRGHYPPPEAPRRPRWRHVIAFASDAPQAGKDTLAVMVSMGLQENGFSSHHLKFAMPLKKAVAKRYKEKLAPEDFLQLCDSNLKDTPLSVLRLYNVGDKGFMDWATREGFDLFDPRSPREVLRMYGTSYVREFLKDNHRWSDWVAQMIEASYEKDQKVIITDLRFPHEWALLAENGAKVVYIHGPDGPATGIGEGLINPKACDYVVHNIKGNPQSMLTQLTMQQFFWKESQQ